MSTYTYELIKENDRLPARFGLVRTSYMTFPAHWHKYVEILYLVSGKMTAVIQAETYELSVGDIVVINSEDIHMTQTCGEKTEYVLLQISAAQIAAFFPNLELLRFDTWIPSGRHIVGESDSDRAKSPAVRQNPEEGTPEYFLREMMEIHEKKEDGYPLLFSARLYELLYCLYREHSRRLTPGNVSSAHRNFARITQILDWVQEHYRESLGIEEAAAHLGFSREYFCRIFKKHTGQTFLEYVNGVRAMKFYEDMNHCDESITALMEKHGITNYKVFLHTFRKLYGDTPQRVRSRNVQDKLEDSVLMRRENGTGDNES